ncbi:MAG: outer membrane beta-barrel protein, partial [Flavitalea sp.]
MKQVLAIFALLMSMHTIAQIKDSTKKTSPLVTITGNIDAYYRYNFNNPKSLSYNSSTSFTRSSNSFELGMASLKADHSFGKVSATVDLGFGARSEEFAYNDANTRLAVKQAFISYAPSSKIKFTIGSWATHVGYEMVDAYLNRNYSMSYMFTNGPFTHTGVKADISLGGKNAIMVGISNPTDYRTAPGMPKSFIGQYSTESKDDKLKLFLNFVGGKQNDFKKVALGDVVATYTINSTFSVGFNGTFQSLKIDPDSNGIFNKASWWGAAVYLNLDPVSWFGITLRNEYINDKDEYIGLKSVFAPTLSANFKIDNLTIIPEVRFDDASNYVFYKSGIERTRATGSFI